MKISLFLKRLTPKKIWHQIFLVLFLLIIIPLLIFGITLLRASQTAIKTSVLRDHQEIALHARGEIKEHIYGAQRALLLTASILGKLYSDPWRQETTLVELSLRNPAFQRIAAVDLNGQEISISELGSVLQNRRREKAFQEARQGRSYLSEVGILENYVPFLTIGEPIIQSGKVTGVLLADLSLRSIWDLVDQIQVGKTGQAYLIDGQGRIIAHPDKKRVLQNGDVNHRQVLRDVRAERVGTLEESDPTGEKWLTSYAPIEQLSWGLIIMQPQREAFAFSNAVKIHFVFALFFSIIGTLLMSFFLAHYMSWPIRNLIEETRRMARGDFSHTFRIRSRSEIDKLLFSFNRMRQKLRKAQEMEKLSIIGKTATIVAHELKNSLQLIDTFVRILPERHRDKQFIKEFSEMIPKELDFWNNSLRNMIAYSKSAQFSVTEIDLNEVLRDAAALAAWKARQMNISLCVDLEDRLPTIRGNEERLKQAFINIFNNALEATPSSGEIVVATRWKEELVPNYSSYVEAEIRNVSQKIKEEDLQKMFEPFYTTKNDGMGLGLPITKEIIESHGGKIRAVNKNGAISFVISLPTVNLVLNENNTIHKGL